MSNSPSLFPASPTQYRSADGSASVGYGSRYELEGDFQKGRGARIDAPACSAIALFAIGAAFVWSTRFETNGGASAYVFETTSAHAR